MHPHKFMTISELNSISKQSHPVVTLIVHALNHDVRDLHCKVHREQNNFTPTKKPCQLYFALTHLCG